MTKAVRNRILKDVNGNINDHLRNHIHLTNCIHLKNHMHKQSPILGDRSLMRDLAALQRSRSLRDPSASPPSWHSPSVVEAPPVAAERAAEMSTARQSVGLEIPRDGRGLSETLPPIADLSTSKVGSGEVNRRNIGGTAVASECSNKSGNREQRRVRREESSGRNLGTDLVAGGNGLRDEVKDLVQESIHGNSEQRDKSIKQSRRHGPDDRVKTLSEKLNEFSLDSDEVASSQVRVHGRHGHSKKISKRGEASISGHHSGRVKQRKLRGARRSRASVASRDAFGENEMSVASNSFGQCTSNQRYQVEQGDEEYGHQNVTRAPRNGCGIPWNWSRIHHRGKSFLDLAGRSLYCGLSESRLKKTGAAPQVRDSQNIPMMSEYSSSSCKSAEALPLLLDPSGSQESAENAAWFHDYSGELGIFADNLLKHEIDSDLASEARFGGQRNFHGHGNVRHRSLTQKYMPKTFRDLVGQSLVVQALSNAVAKRKVGLLYVFYGPNGTGKTSCARIFARALNCQSLEHPKPCGACNSCISHDMGKSRNIREIGPVSNFDFENIMDLLDTMIISHFPSQYRIFIFDDCDNLPPDCWSAILKVIDRAPRRVLFVLVCSSLDTLPHIIISRCQKFFFPKLKDADIIYTLQWIATKEGLEIDKDALKLISTRSDGSLRDAEMTLEQLSLLGQRISVSLVQELVGLISDEKLVDLLDLALSADTVNTVKSLREIMESGVEPLALMSQLATVITDILAGIYDFTKERPRRKFFRRQALSKDDMEKLRQALKTLSEAEKQLRVSNDRLTWLTAALLQLAPDQQYLLPSSSADTSFNQSPLGLNYGGGREIPGTSNVGHTKMSQRERGLKVQAESSKKRGIVDRNGHAGAGVIPQKSNSISSDRNRVSSGQGPGKFQNEIEDIWLNVLKRIQITSLKEFLYREGNLTSVRFGAAPTVHLVFSSHVTKSKAEKFRVHILQAFESVIGSPVTIEIRCESRKDSRAGSIIFPASHDGLSSGLGNDDVNRRPRKEREGASTEIDTTRIGKSEIVELETSPKEVKHERHIHETQPDRRSFGNDYIGEASSTAKNSNVPSVSDVRKLGNGNPNLSLMRRKVSLAHVLQRAEGCAQQSGWSQRKAVSIAEKLEQENLRLEPRSRSLLCWKTTRVSRRKLSRLKTRSRRPKALLKLVSCGKCLSGRSSR
ncbi:protein STICHEL-like 3 isoform X2 [Ipomoea triloba]|uniref:protein STICHEL-like 3 isoform X2 n=1 Tax=Ipomoea triloba TaxID=35885 RepID=UPI00125D0CF7|nr:protein STICHEL-like 3 isoform X2 [Ipomoea triloba]